ncbi:MAG: hypothetical protein GC192_19345 [Bacteroidetes bacterium]|nr:hypothetical protein [Bacteroidota bacterium]
MGSRSMTEEIYIGDVQIEQNGLAKIESSFSQAFNVQIILHDKLGRSVLTENIIVEEQSNCINFDTSNLKPGDYHAWIYIEEKVFVKHFRIEEDNSSFWNKIVSKFK